MSPHESGTGSSPPPRGEGSAPARFRKLKIAAASLALLLATATATLLHYAANLPPLDLAAASERSTVVLDREGRLLRPFLTADGRWKLPVGTGDVDPRYLAMLKAYEDRRFDSHAGIDPLGLVRAAGQMLWNGRIVSGGSTLTMQVARLLEPREERSLGAKLRQAVRAVELERRFTKTEILDLYLTLAPFGGNLEGVRAASLAWFGKEPKRLSTAEAALLVALPQSPETRRPDRFVEAARKARDRVLARVEQAGLATAAEVAAARDEPVPTARKPFPTLAPHVAEQVVAEAPAARSHRLSLDARLQSALEALARDRSLGLSPQVSIAILAVDNETGEIRASVGGVDYFAAERAGSLDLTRALRSPGSALKPFIYALAFDNGIAHPETMLEDRPARYGLYVPENFDMTFQGMVSARKALQLSLNVPAVELLSALGPQRFLSRLRDAGVAVAMPREGGAPGLAIGLGGLGITLQDLTRLYVGLARGGDVAPLKVRAEDGGAPSPRLVEPVAASAAQCRARPHRLQDRHLLWLSRRLGGGLRPQAYDRRLGRPRRQRRRARPRRACRRGAHPVRRLCAPRAGSAPLPAAARQHRRDIGPSAAAAAPSAPGRAQDGCRDDDAVAEARLPA